MFVAPKPKQDHDGNRRKICIFCLKKSKDCVLNDELRWIFANNVYESYELFVSHEKYLPTGLCSGCTRKVRSFKEASQRSFELSPKYDELVEHVRSIVDPNQAQTRSRTPWDPFNCPCEICVLGRHSGKGFPTSRFIREEKRGRGRSSERPKEDLTPIKICPKCGGKIGRGIPHPCTRTSRFENVKNSLTPKTSLMLAKDIIAEEFQKALDKGDEKFASLTSKHGPPLKIKAHDVKDKTFIITEEMVNKLRLNLNISKTKAYEAGRMFKEYTGGKLEKGLKAFIFNSETCLSDFFKVTEMEFMAYNPLKMLVPVKRQTVQCIDVEGLVFFLKMERLLPDEAITKIGQSSFITIFAYE